MGILRGIFVVSIVSFATLAPCQQGGGGFGGGGGGFGGGGFGGGNLNGQLEGGPGRVIFPGKRNDSSELSNWTAKNIILTPGDKVEWKFTAKRGQVIFATAESDAFDPALAIVDSKDKVLTENDDQYEGEQTPYVSYVVKDDGEYKILVRNYRSTSGGRFTLFTKFSQCLTIVPGNNLLELAKTENGSGQDYYVTFNGEKGKIYGILRSNQIFKEATARATFDRLIGPSGVSDLDYVAHKSFDENTIFEAKQTGNYLLHYFTYSSRADKPATVGFSLAEINSEKVDFEGDAVINLLPGQQKLLLTDIKKGTALFSRIKFDQGIANIMSFDQKVGTKKNYVNETGFQWIPKNSSNSTEGFRFFGADGTLNYCICNFGDKPGTLTIKNGIKLDELSSKSSVADHLAIGEASFFWLNGSKLDIQHIVAASKQMEVTMDFLDEDMKTMHFIDSSNHAPNAILNYGKTQRFLVTVTSAGRGGSGDYSLHFDKILPNKITLGATSTIAASATGSAIYEAVLEKDVYYEVVLRGPEGYDQLSDPDGENVNYNFSQYEDVRVYRFKAPKSGPYRMYFPPSHVGSKFRVDRAVVPKIDK